MPVAHDRARRLAVIALLAVGVALLSTSAAAAEPPANPRPALQSSATVLRQKGRMLRSVAVAERKRCAELRRTEVHPCSPALADAIAAVEGVARAADDLADRVADRLASVNDPAAGLERSKCDGGDVAACERVRAADLPLEGYRKMFVAPAEERLGVDAEAALKNLDRVRGEHRATAGKMPKKGSVSAAPVQAESAPPPAKVQDDRKVGNEPLPPLPSADTVLSCRKGDVAACRTAGERLLQRKDPNAALPLLAKGCGAKDAACCANAGIAADQLTLLAPSARNRQVALAWHDKACALKDRGGCHRAAAAVLMVGKDIGRGVRLAMAACELGDCSDCQALAGTLTSNLTGVQKGKVRQWAKGCP